MSGGDRGERKQVKARVSKIERVSVIERERDIEREKGRE